ncbi:glycoside hydrolase family 2 protein [Pedobacter changchengzhani]|uniref:Glycoside hydrolase family 2 protein n=1 Tax=Pedobacter changchengzhani TaxID=2529274 RepID=A0A4R5MKR9_9SPHI|nr:glycoside hydrolase family 2 TIM barrel-domain containing protein [Pedobacter changchengzhani]TDG36172.1 glycoside hydrolase family 2 protein [Pedobacter changchengzhani]
MRLKKTVQRCLFILLTFNGLATIAQKKVSINENWEFSKVEQSTNWEKINLPHTWNATDVIDEIPGYYRGIGWYKKQLKVSFSKNERVYLKFEGANNNTEVFVNGKSVGTHVGGYTAFIFDVTAYLNPVGENEIKVKVDNAVNLNDLPVSADFTFYGGIYRDVFLIVKDELHFDMKNSGSSGVFISTPSVSAKKGTVKVVGKIENESNKPKKIALLTTIKDAFGKVVYESTKTKNIAKNAIWDFNFSDAEILNPNLWSPEQPNLYAVELKIIDQRTKKIIDSSTQPLGFRWFRFDADKGFFLNDKHLKLIGTNRHQDREGYGNALTGDMHEQDIRLIKDMGANFIRIAHYPQDPRVLEMCDKLGLLVWEEIPVVNEINTTKEFADHAKLSLVEMIRQHYNHPSIIIWAYMNEIFATNKMRKLVERKELLAKTTALAKELEKIVKTEDSSRKTAMALEYTYADEYLETGIGNVCDIVGWNLYIGWYQEDMTKFGPFLDDWHKKYPTKSFIISEYGAGSDTRIHSLTPTRYDYSVEYQEDNLESYYQQIMARPFVSGATVWNSFDFNSEGRMDVVPNINNKGLLTVDRKPKDSYYFFKAALSSTPFIKIASSDWMNRAGRAESEQFAFCKQPVVIYSNLPNVELFNNGVSLGVKPTQGFKAIWDVPFNNGLNQLVAKANNKLDQIAINFHLQPYLLSDPSFTSIAVNFGSKEYFLEQSTGLVWEPEREYTEGYWGFVKNNYVYTQPTRFDVKRTTNDPLFYAYLKDANSIKFDVADGNYEVELLFVDQIGNNRFSTLINGNAVFAYPSQNQEKAAITVKAFVEVTTGKGLIVSFDKMQGSPIISGIKIRKRF